MKRAIYPSLFAILTLGFSTADAGEEHFAARVDAKQTQDFAAPEPEAPYYGARGLITLSGPSGMFINPTSGTLPEGKFTLQYCLLWPNRDTDVVGHGWLLGYGVKDWLEVGLVANLVDRNAAIDDEEFGIGPQVRVRLLRDQEWWPELSVGGYGKYGSPVLQETALYVVASKRLIINPDGFFRSAALHAGYRHVWRDDVAMVDNSPFFYVGGELEFPYRIYAVGEFSSEDKSTNQNPWAVGLQCRLPGVALSVAALQNGSTHRVGLWTGIGITFGF